VCLMLWYLPVLLLQPQALDLPASDKNPFTSRADVESGRRLFGGRCAGCHGPGGDGGKGANLGVSVLPRAADDLSLYRVIRYGIPDTEMPGTLLSTREVWQVAAFVRTLGRVSRQNVPGDPRRGAALVRGKGGCLQCHTIGAEGGRLGPSLSDIGERRSAAHLRAKLLDPSIDIPDQFRVVELKTENGMAVSGIRLNEDTWSIQMRDFDGNLRSFWKQNVTELKAHRRTPMPSYRERLSKQEIDDTVAYLAGLRGAQ
jgi:cytochrome c oxidase cbb3-type subunit III